MEQRVREMQGVQVLTSEGRWWATQAEKGLRLLRDWLLEQVAAGAKQREAG